MITTPCRWPSKIFALLLVSLFAFAMLPAYAKKLPKTTHDGLVLVEHTKVRAVYMKPGASLAQYNRVVILDCYVAFAKNWQRDYNDEVVGLAGRIDTQEMDRMKTWLAAEFKKVFTKQLEAKGFPVVTEGGTDVLILRPAIINLEVAAPDVMTPGMSETFVASAGQMTLYLELYDSVTSDIIARIIDPEAAPELGGLSISSGPANKMAADELLKRWADLLRDHLGAVQARDK